jgi:rhomboid protease GluP
MGFLITNIVIFVLMSLAGGTTNEATLLAFGVKANTLIDSGQWWRFVTPVFIHIGLLHLLFNSYALWSVGQQVEKLYGSARFVLLYVVTGVAGVAASYFYHPMAISAGASGAIFGLFGVLLVFGLRYRSTLPPFFARAVGTGVLPVIVINLIIGFSIPAIDNSAHVGGLIAGAILAAIIPYEKPDTRRPPVFAVAQALSILLVVVSFFEVGLNYDGPRVSLANLGSGVGQITGSKSTIEGFIDAVNNTQRTFSENTQTLGKDELSDLADVRKETVARIDELKNVPSLDPRADELTGELLMLMQSQYELIENIARAGTVTLAHSRQLRQEEERYNSIMESFEDWANTEGKKHGIQMGKKP